MSTPQAAATATQAAAPRRHPVLELLARYRAIFGMAWTHRHELAGPQRLADEAAFLPAALSLQETPVHPAPRRLAWGIVALFFIALIWSIVGLTLPLFRVVLSPMVTRLFYAVPRTSVARTASG